MKEWLIWISAGVAAVFALLFGVNLLRRGSRSRFSLALSASLLWLCGLTGLGIKIAFTQEKPEVQRQDKIQALLKEIKKDPRWRKLHKIYHKLYRHLKAKKPLTEKLDKWRQEARQKQKKNVETPKDRWLARIEHLVLTLANEIEWKYPRDNIRMLCYVRCAPIRLAQIDGQIKLLEEAFRKGRISQAVYEKAKKALGCFVRSRCLSFSDEDFVILGRLIVEFCKPLEPLRELTPELSKRIEDLIKKLGDDNFEIREDAHKKLLEIGEVTIPLLKEELKTSTDPEVRWRIEVILEELEYWK